MPPDARQRSWTASSQRRSRLNAKGGGTTNNAVDGINCIAASQYAKQLNPYKQHSSSLRGSTGSAVQYQTTRGVSNDDDLGLNVDADNLDLGDDDDDDMRLENILASIVDDSKSDVKMPSLDNVGKNPDDLGVIDEDSSKYNHRTAAEALPSVVESDNFHPKISTSSVDFGGEISHPREMPPIHNTDSSIHEIGNISPVSDEDNGTNWSDGDATKLHKMMAQIDQVPAFASGGFEDATKLESISRMNGPTFRQIAVNNSGSFVDSIIDDIDMSYGSNGSDIFISGPESDNNLNPLANSTSNLSPPRGRFSSSYNDRHRSQSSKTMLTNPENAAHGKPHDDAPQSNVITSNTSERKLASTSRFTPQTHLLSGEIVHLKTEDETLSNVTDPTESPFIYAYKKSHDDDSVSQITSSLAGNSLASSHLLQNIPNSTGVRIHSSGLSWMASNDGLTRGVGGNGGSRMMNRKGGMIISGPYGRGRDRKLPKAASGGNGYGRRNNKSSSSSGGGSAGGDSYDSGKKNLDEIAYALNADCSSGRNHRAMVTRRPPVRVGGARLASGGDDLSTVVSRNSRDDTQGDHQSSSYAYVDANINTNVSRLGMGGVSCAAQSVYSEGTADSTITLGFFQRLALIVWKAQHHAGRFFFPTSLAVKRRKKFDKSDSMSDLEEILLEEGSKALSHRQQSSSRGGHYDDDDDDDIDYFSRAMSVSNNHNISGGLRKSKNKRYFWQSKAARMACLIFVLAITFTIYRMPKKKEYDYYEILPNKGRFDAGKKGRFYDFIHHGNDQVFDYATDAMVDSDAYHGGRAGIADADRVGQETAGLVQEQNYPVQDDIQLPPVFEVLANVKDLLFQRGIDVPFYWHVPRSGGGTMNDVLGSCFHLTLAADAGGSEGHGGQETLEVLHLSRQVSYVNVDTSTHQGIARAKSLNLVSSGLADVVISPHLHEASTLFTPTRRGRMFTMFRHPVERSASLFYFLQETQWRQPDIRSDQFADISIEKFYKGGFAENNWMTRFLTNNFGELTENDLSIAKKVLRQKCLVGLLEEKVETFNRMQHYFGWDPKSDEDKKCLEKRLEWSWPMKHKHPKIEKDSKAWTLIVAANSFDLKLYGYAKELFYLQGQQLFSQ